MYNKKFEIKSSKHANINNAHLPLRPYLNGNSILNPQQAEHLLLRAARVGNLNAVKDLIKKGTNIDAQNEWGATALYISIVRNHKLITKFLIDNNANVNRKTMPGDTPLNFALGLLNIESAEMLIAKGADIHTRTFDETPLYTAVKNGQVNLVNLLILYGADMEALSHKSLTPLDAAIRNMHLNTAELLILFGANISNENVDDVVVQPVNIVDFYLSYLITAAAKLDCIHNKSSQLFHDPDGKIYEIYKDLCSSHKDILSNRILYKAFWNKPFTPESLQKTVEALTEKVNYLNDEMDLELSAIKETIENFQDKLAGINLDNEAGRVKSLLSLVAYDLHKTNFWEPHIMSKDHPDIYNKIHSLEELGNFFKKFNIKLVTSDQVTLEEDISQDDFKDNMLLSGDNDNDLFMETE